MQKDKDIVDRVYNDLHFSFEKLRVLKDKIKDDFQFEQGKQWDDSDVATLKARGVKALTINKIKPIVRLLTGIERQSRSDFKAFPEGGEDVITAEIVTRLIKNVVKNSRVEIKESQMFKDGAIGGMSFIEPYVTYDYDLINGDLRWKKIKSSQIFFDPNFEEYDMSDAKYVGKITAGLTKDELINLFPDKESEIKKTPPNKLDIANLQALPSPQDGERHDQYQPMNTDAGNVTDKENPDVPTYDLIDYYYKDYRKKYYAVNTERAILEEFDTIEEAEEYAVKIQGQTFDRKVPVIVLAQVSGSTLLYNDVSWTYPRWRGYPIIPYFADLLTEDLDEYELKIQGIVRGIKDLNLEFNKRRTQELTHINSSTNSGFDIEKGQLDEKELANLKKNGSSPGFVVQRKKGTPPVNRLTPMPLSQGHAQLAAENAQDLKEASGVNPDLLANDSQSQSGRAILLKQRQGLVMIQELLDNFAETKRLIGRFILSQLAELFTVESAMRVLGDAYITDNFTVPTNAVLERGLTKLANGQEDQISQLENSVMLQYPGQDPKQPIVDEMGMLVTMVDMDTAILTVSKILNDKELNKFDVAIGEGPYSDTIRMANFTDLKELAQQGVPIPPQSLIELSMIPDAEKKNILQLLSAQMQASQAQPAEQTQ